MHNHESKSRREDAASRRPRRPEQQSNMEQTSPSASLETAILARLGLRQQPAAVPDDSTVRIANWQKRIMAAQRLAREGKQAQVEELCSRYLVDPDERVRMAAIRELEKIAQVSPGLVSPGRFIGALGDEHPQVRATSVQALTSLGTSWLTDGLIAFLVKTLVGEKALERWLKEEQKPEREHELVRIAIMQLFARLHIRGAVPALIDQLSDKDWQVRETAVLSLGSFLDELSPQQYDMLWKRLYDDNYFVRDATILILKGRWPIQDVLRTLRSRSSPLQAQAARILGELGEPEDIIIDALHDVAIDLGARSSGRVAALLSLKALQFDMPERELSALREDLSEEVREAAEMLADPHASETFDLVEPERRGPIRYDLGSSENRER